RVCLCSSFLLFHPVFFTFFLFSSRLYSDLHSFPTRRSSDLVVIAGLTFKENTPDFRNSKVMNMSSELNDFGIRPKIVDPYVESYNGELEADIIDFKDITEPIDVLLYAVDHKEFKETKDNEFINLLDKDNAIIIDLKNRFKKYESDVVKYWSI